MKLKNIKPSEKHLELFRIKEQEYYEYFFDSNGKELNASFSYKRTCPICSSDCSKLLFEKFKLNYVRCSCGMVYIDPYIVFEKRSQWYKESDAYNWFWTEIVLKARQQRIENVVRPRIEKLKKEECSFENVLDVGCGLAGFVETLLQDRMGAVKGIEPNSTAVEIARKYVKDAVIQGMIQNVDFSDESFSLITMWEVFHHFDDPLKVMKRLFDLLKPGGSIVLQSPNFAGFEYNVLGKYHHDVTFEIPNYFDANSISQLLERAGFLRDNIQITTPGQLDVDYVLLGIERNGRGIIKDAFTKSIIERIVQGEVELKDNVQKFLVENNLSGSMLVIAKKQ